MTYTIDDLQYLMRRLRDPKTGCPWDLRQRFETIVAHTLEESYELADAIERGEKGEVRQELGDLLFQVIFHCRLGEEEKAFDLADVIDGLVQKLVRRHPHVFPDGELYGATGAGPDRTRETDVKHRWESIKREERAQKEQHGLLDDVPLALPALSRSAKLQKRSAAVGFDWPDVEGVLAKCREELQEVERALSAGDAGQIEHEIGDLMFCWVNLARHLKVDPETALRRANSRFERRFQYIEARLKEGGSSPHSADSGTMNALWDQAKAEGL